MTASLITRLAEAAEGSRELDREMALATGVLLTGIKENGEWGVKEGRWTQSIDAALALAERVLPEADVLSLIKTPHGWAATAKRQYRRGHWIENGEHPSSPALALCLAVLKANHKDKP